MITQYFVELEKSLTESLSDALHRLVNQAEDATGSGYMEVWQVIRHNEARYTVILNVDMEEDNEEEGEAAEEDEE